MPVIGQRIGRGRDSRSPCAYDTDTPEQRNTVGHVNDHRGRPLSRWAFTTIHAAGHVNPDALPTVVPVLYVDVCAACDEDWVRDVKYYGRPMTRDINGTRCIAPTNTHNAHGVRYEGLPPRGVGREEARAMEDNCGHPDAWFRVSSPKDGSRETLCWACLMEELQELPEGQESLVERTGG